MGWNLMNTWGEIKFKLEMDVCVYDAAYLDCVCLCERQVGLGLQIRRDG